METVIRTQGLGKAYGRLKALDDVSIEVGTGQIYGLVGQNGAGKTTLIRLLTGLARPSAGELSLFGRTTGLNRQRRRAGALIDVPALCLDLTARQHVEALRVQRGLAGRHWTDEVLEIVGLADEGGKKVRSFSLGMRQRLALASAFLGDPELLVLDEPVNGLDPTWMIAIRHELVRRAREQGTTVLVSSHLLAELDLFASHYGFIHHGRLVQQISADELHARCERSLRIGVDDPARAATVLEESFGVRHYTIGDGGIVLAERLEDAAALNAALVDAGVAVGALEARSMSLENYYTELVKGA